MDINVGKVSSDAKFFDPKMIQEIARAAARIVQEEMSRNQRSEQDRRLTNSASGDHKAGS